MSYIPILSMRRLRSLIRFSWGTKNMQISLRIPLCHIVYPPNDIYVDNFGWASLLNLLCLKLGPKLDFQAHSIEIFGRMDQCVHGPSCTIDLIYFSSFFLFSFLIFFGKCIMWPNLQAESLKSQVTRS